MPYFSRMSAARRGGAFGDGIQRHPRPVAGVEDGIYGVLLDMVDPDATAIDVEAGEHFEDGFGSVRFVREMRRVDQDELTVGHGQLDVRLERVDLVPRRFVQAGLTDTQAGRLFEELRHRPEDIAGQLRASR